MIIGVDIRPLVSNKRSGVEEYGFALLSELISVDRKNEYVLFNNSFKKPPLLFRDILEHENVELVTYRFPNKVLNFLFRFSNFPKIDKLIYRRLGKEIGLFFMPNILFASLSKKVKKVITFHDLSFVHFSEFLSLKRKLWHRAINPKGLALRSDKIIAVSDFTKLDLIKTYGIESSKIETIHSGVVESDKKTITISEVKEKYHLPDSFMLCLGTLEPRKNIVTVLEAYLKLKKSGKYPALVICGAKGWKTEDLFLKPREFFVENDIHFTGYIEEKDKDSLFRAAKLFIYPSFFEGFGFPLLEAAKARTPIVAAADSSIFEVISKGALFFDPCNVFELMEVLKKVINSSKTRERLIRNESIQVSKYSIGKTAAKTLALFEEVYSGL